MKKYLTIYLYGAVIVLGGLFLLFSGRMSIMTMRLVLGIVLTLAAGIAFVAAFFRRKQQVQLAYHELHALALLIYGVLILFFANSFEHLISITSFLFFFYALSEIIFSNWIFNGGKKVNYRVVFVRVLLGLVIGFGTVTGMNFTEYTREIFGVLFVIIGINIVFYVPVLKERHLREYSP
jgi:uncharacterized membrane protein HdeD (DUF308 family)